jgi:hypothetical protein
MIPHRTILGSAAFLAAALLLALAPARAQTTTGSIVPDYPPPPAAPPAYAAPPPAQTQTAPAAFGFDEIVATGHQVFGEVSQGLAALVERAVSQYGLPNGYIVGEEASGAFIGGARYGEGILYTKNAGSHRVYWQGPSLGLDVGATGSRVMMMVYNLPSVEAIYNRYVGVNGSAYVVAGLGMTVLSRDGIYVVPVVSGIGARLGVNFGYLKFTAQPTWNPF